MSDLQIPADGFSEPDSFAPPESLNIRVAIIGPQGSGKSTLTRTLCQHTEQFSPEFLDSYFRGEEGCHELLHHRYPPLPNTTLLDCPGYKSSDPPSHYLESIKVDTVQCLVVTVRETISDADLQLLGALKHKGKPHYVVLTHTDLVLHTEKRRQGKGYWRGQTLKGLKDRVEEQLQGAGLQGSNMFMVSCLEPQSFDFPSMVDYLEGEILQCKRSVYNTTEYQCQELAALFETDDQESLVEFSPLLSSLLDYPPPMLIVVGVAGNNTDNTLLLESPCLVLRALPGPGKPPLPVNQYLQNLQLENCDIYLIIGTELDPSFRVALIEALVAGGKHCMLIGGEDDQGKEQNASGEVEGGSHMDTDLPGLKLALEKGAPQLIRERIVNSLPSIIKLVVRRERRRVMKGIYDLCLGVCAKASLGQHPLALSSLSSAISSFRSRFGLDNDSLARIAQVTGCPAEDLHSEIHCHLAQDMTEEQLLQMVTQPLSLSEIVWSYIPYGGEGEKAPTFSPERTYRLLVEGVYGMAQDAESVLLHCCTKQKRAKEKTAICHWPCV
ncbi:uncharacterized protein WCC33_011869 [Rhinophrynus dorsalis]